MRNYKTHTRATDLRKRSTDAERFLWHQLRARQLAGFKFRRQFPLGPFVAFACLEAQLVVELDGGQHADAPHDAARDGWLQQHGWRVLRFWNDQVFKESSAVLQVILETLNAPTPALPRKRGREKGVGLSGSADDCNAPTPALPRRRGRGESAGLSGPADNSNAPTPTLPRERRSGKGAFAGEVQGAGVAAPGARRKARA